MARSLPICQSMKNSWISAGIIAFVLVAMSYLGSWVTRRNKDWYRALELPSFNPPDYTFGIVWTVIYILMGIAAWRLWVLTDHDNKFWWLAGFAVANVLLNVGWSYVFFGAHLMWPAVAVCATLWITIVALIFLAWPKDVIAASLLIPYALWVAFATFLNGTVAALNT